MSKGIQLKAGNENTYPNAYYKIGDIFISNNNDNPSSQFEGNWKLLRTLYGGELLAFGSCDSSGNGTANSGTGYAWSDSIFPNKQWLFKNYIDGILGTSGGAFSIQTKGIVGFVECEMFISGLGASGNRGVWWRGNSNPLPTGVTLMPNYSTDLGTALLTGPHDANYGGHSNRYFYNVDTTDDIQFYANPRFAPYNGAITINGGGVRCKSLCKVYAKYETTYLWIRIA